MDTMFYLFHKSLYIMLLYSTSLAAQLGTVMGISLFLLYSSLSFEAISLYF
jgi:hypothetical protein